MAQFLRISDLSASVDNRPDDIRFPVKTSYNVTL